jgi:uncharacterized protein YbjQ (UPF0145 family)
MGMRVMTLMRTVLAGALALAMIGAARAQTAVQDTAKAPHEIALYDQDIPWAYEKIGDVRATYFQTALFQKISVQERLETSLRDQAAKLGADAVIQVRYDLNSPLSKKGNHADGIAVRLAPQEPSASPTESGPTEAGALVASPAAPRAPYAPGMIVLAEQDLPQRYVKLGEVRAQAFHTSVFMKVPMRAQLNQQLRDQATKLGANAVVLIKYDLSSPMQKRPGTAVGMAVRFE